MFFLLRVAFWLSVVLALLPTGSSQPGAQAAESAPPMRSSRRAPAVSDMSNFCDRQPEACVVGAQAAVALGQRAQAGAKMVYDSSASTARAPRRDDGSGRRPVRRTR